MRHHPALPGVPKDGSPKDHGFTSLLLRRQRLERRELGRATPKLPVSSPAQPPGEPVSGKNTTPPPVPPLGPGLGRCASDQQKINKRNILKTFFFLIRERERERTSGGSGRQREKQGAQSRTRPQDPGIIPEPKAVT